MTVAGGQGTSPDPVWSASLASRTGPRLVGRLIHAYEAVGSTNDELKLIAAQGAGEGTVVTARAQLKGRGRLGREWVSPHGRGVYLSALFRPDWPAADAGWLAVMGGVAVAGMIEELGLRDVAIKWPNDVLVRGRKIAGVLVEPRVTGGRIEFAVIGVGVNLSHEESDWHGTPAEGRATSCMGEGIEVSLDDAILCLLRHLDAAYALARDQKQEALMDVWRRRGGTATVPAVV